MKKLIGEIYLQWIFVWCQKPFVIPPSFNQCKSPNFAGGMSQRKHYILNEMQIK